MRFNERQRVLYESVKAATPQRREQRDQIIITGHRAGKTTAHDAIGRRDNSRGAASRD